MSFGYLGGTGNDNEDLPGCGQDQGHCCRGGFASGDGAVQAQLQASGTAEKVPPGYTEGGAKACLDCHDETATVPILRTRHAVKNDTRTPFANQECETCHGPSAAHSDKPLKFTTSMAFGPRSEHSMTEQSAVCLGCHQSESRIHWSGSIHASREVGCTSCHKVHARHDAVRDKRTQPEVCFDCHKTQRSQVSRPSHHPITEGKVSCSDCHNPHGSVGPHLMVRDSVNDTCYTCHMDKRGPFLRAHQPVTENCAICHNPHGTINSAMLKMRTPFLCQQCHEPTGHRGRVASLTAITGTSANTLGRGCVNCHTSIHGTNSAVDAAGERTFRQ